MQSPFVSGPTPGRGGRTAVLAAILGIAVVGCAHEAENRVQSIYDLRRNPTTANLEKIRASLQDVDPQVRVTALFTLVTAEVPDARDLALAALEDPDGFVRTTAATLLGEFRDTSLSSALTARVQDDPDAHVRQRAAEALGRTRGPDAVRGLSIGLVDPIKGVRLASAVAAAEAGPREHVATLRKLVVDDPEWEVRVQAARALGMAQDASALPEIERALGDPSEFVRAAAALARKRIADASIAPVAVPPGPAG